MALRSIGGGLPVGFKTVYKGSLGRRNRPGTGHCDAEKTELCELFGAFCAI